MLAPMSLACRIYWTALGAGPDYLNGLNWKDGYLASMKANGKPVAQSAWVTLPFNKHVLVTPASTQAARLGDLVFFGYGSSKHVRRHARDQRPASRNAAALVHCNRRASCPSTCSLRALPAGSKLPAATPEPVHPWSALLCAAVQVGLYVGGNQMVSFAGNLTGKDYGLPQLESVYARGDIDQIRQVLRAPCMARTAGSLVGPPGCVLPHTCATLGGAPALKLLPCRLQDIHRLPGAGMT